MTATVYNLSIEQGIPYVKEFQVKEATGANKNLTGYTARMQFRPYPESTELSLDATTANTKLIIDTVSSLVKINLSEADTKALAYTSYSYDIELVDSSNKPIRLVQGSVSLSREVTR